MRTSVTLSDETDNLITEYALKIGISKDKLISTIVDDWINIHKNGSAIQKHNARGAGRKKQYGNAHKLAMQTYKAQGLTYRDIAKIYDCSVGTVCKLLKEGNI